MPEDDEKILLEMLGLFRRPVVPPPGWPRGRPPGRGNQNPGQGNNAPVSPPGPGGIGSPGRGNSRPSVGGGSTPVPLVASTQVASATSPGPQTITIEGLGWTPKFVMITMSTATAVDTLTAHGVQSVGVSDGTNQYCMTMTSLQGASSVAKRYGDSESIVAQRNTGSSTLAIKAELTGLVENGCTINWTTAPGTARILNVLFVGGNGVTAAVGKSVLTTAGGTKTITPDFETNALILLHNLSGTTSIFNGAYGVNAPMGIGFGSWDGSTVLQSCYTTHASDAQATANITSRNSATTISQSATTGGTVTLGNITSTSFDLTTATDDYSGTEFVYCAFNLGAGGQAWAGMADGPAATGDHALTGMGITPAGGLVLTTQRSDLGVNTNDDAGVYGLSFIDADDEMSAVWIEDDGNVNPNPDSYMASKAIYLPTDTGAAEYTGTRKSFEAGGVTFDMTASSATVTKWPVLMLGTPD